MPLACHRCNERRYNFTTAIDPETQQEVALFNPRQQDWANHFRWKAGGLGGVLGQLLWVGQLAIGWTSTLIWNLRLSSTAETTSHLWV